MNIFQVEYLHWTPLLWLGIFFVLFIVMIIVGKLFFRNDYNTVDQQSLPFYSGTSNKMLQMITASNLYWGFKHALDVYFTAIKKLFISDVEDFIQWFIIIIACMLLLVTGVL
ncbi:MAG: hypothetical protein N3F66_00440 [Spirochaetes bacterium]|nr:hypothetical protein [Spirochaetota bacterium]